MEQWIVSATAIATAIGVAVKQILDVREIKRWICYKNPCEHRDNKEPT